MDDRGALR
jgi:hypothetical protein